MQRRSALKNLLLLAGGTVLLPSCVQEDKKVSIPLNHLTISAEQETLLAAICETIIPKTDTPGAKELGVHQFVLTMVDDCTKKEDQETFINGLNQIDKLSQKLYNNSFGKINNQQREELLTKLDKKEVQGEAQAFFERTKRLTIQGYLKSQYVMTNLLKYELVPGRFHGSFPIIKATLTQNG
jgi:hypothetical protein